MAGKPKENPNLTQQQEIAAKKQECIKYYEANGVKQAAADWIGRTLKTVNEWEADDADFREAMLRAKATFFKANRYKVKLDNLFANMYPDDFKPPKQEIEQTVTDSKELELLRQLVHDAAPVKPLPPQQPTD